MVCCGIKEDDIAIVTGYRGDKIKEYFKGSALHFIDNPKFESTNMVYSFMCAADILNNHDDILISYGDIVYTPEVLKRIMDSEEEMSVVTDDNWYEYWALRCENPLDDAETLIKNEHGYLIEIGQKTTDIKKVQSQYIGLIRFQKNGVKQVLNLCAEAENRSRMGVDLWRTKRDYNKMYMTDLLQGLIDEGMLIKAIPIERGWFEVDSVDDLKLAEKLIWKE